MPVPTWYLGCVISRYTPETTTPNWRRLSGAHGKMNIHIICKTIKFRPSCGQRASQPSPIWVHAQPKKSKQTAKWTTKWKNCISLVDWGPLLSTYAYRFNLFLFVTSDRLCLEPQPRLAFLRVNEFRTRPPYRQSRANTDDEDHNRSFPLTAGKLINKV